MARAARAGASLFFCTRVGDNDAMRLFVASFLPPDDLVFYDAVVAVLVARDGDALRAIPRRSAHVTHAFLGEVRDTDVAGLTAAIAGALDGQPAANVQIGAPVLLRARRMPRLVMAPVTTGAEPVRRLSGAIVAALRTQRPFADLPEPKHAHVTLARVRPRATARDGDQLEAALREMNVRPRAMRLTHVQLVASTLAPEAPAYRTLEAWPLREAESLRNS